MLAPYGERAGTPLTCGDALRHARGIPRCGGEHDDRDESEHEACDCLPPFSYSTERTKWCKAGGAIRTLTLFFFFLLWHPLSDVWWLPTNRHRLPTKRHRLHINRHRLPTNRHRLPTGRHHRAYWTLRVFLFYFITAPPGVKGAPQCHGRCRAPVGPRLQPDSAQWGLCDRLPLPRLQRCCAEGSQKIPLRLRGQSVYRWGVGSGRATAMGFRTDAAGDVPAFCRGVLCCGGGGGRW